MYDFHLRLIGKRFLFFSLDVMAEVLQALSKYLLKISIFA